VSDYLKATASLWQEGFEVAMRHQSAFGETLSNAMRSWQSTGTSGFEKAAAMAPAAMPLWFKSLSMPTALAQPANFKGDGSIQSRKPSHDGDHLAA